MEVAYAGSKITHVGIPDTNINQLTAQINATDIQTAGSFPIDVLTPAPGGGISSAINLGVGNPVPSISGLTPAIADAGAKI